MLHQIPTMPDFVPHNFSGEGEPNKIGLSLGAGVQSTVMALMADRGDFGAIPDVAIFADTGWEPEKVYKHLDWLESELKNFKILRVNVKLTKPF
jgi:3'-phosphoadenosine 5'-phosphosulfate sulfotransferase (PAPS reductase)/FAD synthetase